MRALFWKLFATFWLAFIFFLLAVIVSASFYIETLQNRYSYSTPREQLAIRVAEAKAALNEGGMRSLKRWLSDVDNHEWVPLLLVDSDHRDILGRSISPRTFRVIMEHDAQLQEGYPADIQNLSYRTLTLSNNKSFRAYYDYQNATIERLLSRPKIMFLPLLLTSLFAGSMAWLLANYLTVPINLLRKATRHFAQGNLDYRVGTQMGQRRDELVDLAYALDDMAKEWQRILRSQQNLLRDVSHELRSPLSRASIALSLLRKKMVLVENITPTITNAHNDIDRAESELERLNELLGRILQFAKLDSGYQSKPFAPFDWLETLSSVVDNATYEAQSKHIHIAVTMDLSPALTTALHHYTGDSTLWSSAVDNILRNAIRFSPIGGTIAIQLKADNLPHEKMKLILTISDEGEGVKEENLPRLFEPFFREAASTNSITTTEKTASFGLGLAITKHAVNIHGGYLTVINQLAPAHGLIVRIHFPLSLVS